MKWNRIDAALICLLGLFAGVAIFSSAWGMEQVGVVIVSMLLVIAAIIVGSLLIGWRRHTRRRVWPALLVHLGCLLIIISVALTHWPFRIAYALSRDAFDAVATRVRAGEEIETPVRVGLFTIRRAELSWNGIVCLWTQPYSGGNTGFVQCRRDYVPFNLWSMIQLDDRWQLISED